MAQQIALRVWCDRARDDRIAMHPTSHLEIHEHRGYQRLHGLSATLLGNPEKPITAADVAGYPEPLAALVVELPMREVGGILPVWSELEALKAACAARATRLHIDGARLWETRGFYDDRSYAEICAGADSVYVSLYKGLGGLGGAVLAGPQDFIAEARLWLRRHGGNLVTLVPYVVSAAMEIDARLAAMPTYLARARSLASALSTLAFVRIKPTVPHVNMFHVFVRGEAEALDAAHLAMAKTEGLWITGRFSPTRTPGWCSFETYTGDAALEVSDEEVVAALVKIGAVS